MAQNEVSIVVTSKNNTKSGFNSAKADAESSATSIDQTWQKHLDNVGKNLDTVSEKLHSTFFLGLSAAVAAAQQALPPLVAAIGAVGVSLTATGIAAGVFGLMAKTAFTDAATGSSKAQKQLESDIKSMTTQWHSLSDEIATPALVPWMNAVDKGMKDLKPLVQPVATQFTLWGQAVSKYFSSKTGSTEITALATALGKFAGSQFKDLGTFFIDIGKAVVNLASDIAGHNVDFAAFGTNLEKWGAAFLKWSASAAARQDVSKFLTWLHDNGGTVSKILGEIAQDLPNIFKGLSSSGTVELNALSDFLKLVSSLPSWMQTWIIEGLPFLVVGSKVIPAISAAMALVGKVMTMLNTPPVAATADTAAEGGAAAAEGAAIGGGEVAAMEAAAPTLGTLIGAAVVAQVAGYLAYKQFSNMFSSGVKGASSAGQYGSSGEAAPLSAVLAGTGTNTAAGLLNNPAPLANLLKQLGYSQMAINKINAAVVKPGSNVGEVDALIYSLGGTQADILAVNKMIAKPGSDSSNIDSLLKKIGLTPGQIAAVNKLNLKPGDDESNVDAMLKKIGLTPGQIAGVNKLIMKPKSDSSPVTALQKAINSLMGKTVPIGADTGGARNAVQTFQQMVNSLHGTTVTIGTQVIGSSILAAGIMNGMAAGGVTSAATGGPRNGLTLVGERGPELVSLPGGSTVHSNSDTQRMMTGGGTTNVVLSLDSSGAGELSDLIAVWFKKYVRAKGGGNVQTAFGRH